MAERPGLRARLRRRTAGALVRAADRMERRSRRATTAVGPAPEIGPGVVLAEDVVLLTDDLGRTGPIRIGAGAWIARGARVLPGVTVGAGAVVRSYSVVIDDVAPHTVVEGNPAREVGRRAIRPSG